MSMRAQIARAIFEETRRQYAEQDGMVRIDQLPMRYITWESCEQEPYLRMADAVLALPAFPRLTVVR